MAFDPAMTRRRYTLCMSSNANAAALARDDASPGHAAFGGSRVPSSFESETKADNNVSSPAEARPDVEIDLLARLRAGDDAAYETLVRTYTPRLLVVARRVSLSEADAEDAVQDAFVSVFKAIGNFDGRSSLGTWLHRIVVNCAITRARKSHSRRETSLEGLLPTFQGGRHSESPGPWKAVTSEGGPSVQVVEAVHAALAALPEEFRAVLVLKDVEGMQSAEIAIALGISDSLVRQRVHRGRQAMVKLMTPAMQESEL